MFFLYSPTTSFVYINLWHVHFKLQLNEITKRFIKKKKKPEQNVITMMDIGNGRVMLRIHIYRATLYRFVSVKYFWGPCIHSFHFSNMFYFVLKFIACENVCKRGMNVFARSKRLLLIGKSKMCWISVPCSSKSLTFKRRMTLLIYCYFCIYVCNSIGYSLLWAHSVLICTFSWFMTAYPASPRSSVMLLHV